MNVSVGFQITNAQNNYDYKRMPVSEFCKTCQTHYKNKPLFHKICKGLYI